ncbi:MAG: guanylate kinase [Oscillospiraceae bacterium]|nr:guanylate kinase [Oscillospiraceae bacterium]
MSKGLLVVVSAPAGCGKDTVLDLLNRECENVHRSVSATTRQIREGEKDGLDYFFVNHGRFKEMLLNNELLEHAEYVGNYYGTPKAAVYEKLDAGLDVVLKIEVEGAENIRKLIPECVLIFILPPSFDELERRLRERGTEDEFAITNRIRRAKEELNEVPKYDYAVVNDDLTQAAENIKAIIRAEKCSTKREIHAL